MTMKHYSPLDHSISTQQLELFDDLQVESLPAPEYLIQGVLTRCGIAMLYGAAGEGKTFVAFDIAFSCATGSPWHGLAIAQGKVIYVLAEGREGLSSRVCAWKSHHAVHGL